MCDRHRFATCLIGTLLVVNGSPSAARATVPGESAPSATGSSRRDVSGTMPLAVGAGRCSATACHGSSEAVYGRRTLGNESSTWETRDPHARAYSVLHTEWSRAIARNLGRSEGKATPAHEDGRCLACHSGGQPAADRELARTIRADGVSCEACHGAAGRWLGLHASGDWDLFSPDDKQFRFGMNRLDDLTRRAESCVGCHVGEKARPGQPAREVNHDLIAAGHPRLAFEFAAFLANMPQHWREKGRNASPDFPARTWAIGQAISARAATELLESRAREAVALAASGRPAPWPELAEYDCASCHRELQARTVVQDASGPRSGQGQAAWGTWYYAMTDPAIDPGANDAASCLDRLRTLMEVPLPSPDEVSREARLATAALARWLRVAETRPLDRTSVDRLIAGVRRRSDAARRIQPVSWDIATQEYLALVPLRQALPDRFRETPGLRDDLLERRMRLNAPFVKVRPATRGPAEVLDGPWRP